MQSSGMNLLARLLADGRLADFHILKREYFYQEELPLFDWIDKHVKKHGVLPSLGLTKRRQDLEDPETDDPYGVWHEQYINRAIHNRFSVLMPELTKLLNSGESQTALNMVMEFSEQAHSIRTDGQRDLVTVAQMGPEVLEELIRLRSMSGISGITTGWEWLDQQTQGFQNGDFIVFAARPGVGKTTCCVYMAQSAYLAGRTPLVVSMEMKRIQMGTKLYALMSGLNMQTLRRGQLTSLGERRLQEVISEVEARENPLYFIEGQFRKHIGEIVSLIYSLRPDIVFIDAAYLIKMTEGMAYKAKWEVIGEIAATLKNAAALNNIPVVATFQITREGGKKDKSGQDVGTEHIQLSDAIGQLASLIVGIFEDDPGDDPTRIRQRRMKILKGREGERGEFTINYDYERMNFTEIVDPTSIIDEESEYELMDELMNEED